MKRKYKITKAAVPAAKLETVASQHSAESIGIITMPASNIFFSKNTQDWAGRWMHIDPEYIRHRAAFAPEPLRSIAKVVLEAAKKREMGR